MPTLDTLQPIQPPVEIPLDLAPLWWLLLGGVILGVVVWLGVRVWREFAKKRQTPSPTEIARARLRALDFTVQDRELLYAFTLLSKQCVAPEQTEGLQSLLLELEPYKYTPHPAPIPESLWRRAEEYAHAATL